MRLIDADELLARIRLNYNNHQNINAAAMKDIINTTKTAYDVEKVVAELEEEKTMAYDKWDGGSSYKAYSHAIDIVRKGGVE